MSGVIATPNVPALPPRPSLQGATQNARPPIVQVDVTTFQDAARAIMPLRPWASWPFMGETQNPTRPTFDLLKTSSGMDLSMEDFDPVKVWNEALFDES